MGVQAAVLVEPVEQAAIFCDQAGGAFRAWSAGKGGLDPGEQIPALA